MDRLPILDLGPQYRSLKPEILGAVERVLESGAFIMGPDVGAFEHEVADYLGVKHAIGLNSGTDALVLAMRALEIGPGDEVITTSFTFFATAEAISRVGATPIFVDVNESTFALDPSSVSGAISSRTKAIVPVHLFGRPADMVELIEIANATGVPIVEDCAQSFGARFLGNAVRGATQRDGIMKREPLAGKQCGTMGVIGAYSFFPSKNLGAYGDGGLVVTDDDSIAEKLRLLHAHGARKKFVNELVGYNSRLDSLQAAVLRVKLPHIDAWNDSRRRVARRYGELLAGCPGMVTPEVVDGHVFHQYTVRIHSDARDRVAAVLDREGISTMVYYPVPTHRLPVYLHSAPTLPVAERLPAEVLSLPIWPELEDGNICRVAGAIRRALA